jgi:hypothetical protein
MSELEAACDAARVAKAQYIREATLMRLAWTAHFDAVAQLAADRIGLRRRVSRIESALGARRANGPARFSERPIRTGRAATLLP